MSYLEDDKEIEFGRPKDPRKSWKRRAKRDERKRKRHSRRNERLGNNDNLFRAWRNRCLSRKSCHGFHGKTPGILARRRKRSNRKRDRYWGT